MKRKLSLLLAMVLAMTMVMGMNLTALADERPPEGCPESVNPCKHPGTSDSSDLLYVYGFNEEGDAKVAHYDYHSGMWISNGTVPDTAFSGMPTLNKVYHKILGSCYYLCPEPSPTPTPTPAPSSPTHVHEWVEGEIYAATQHSDGLGGTYCKTCGAIKESHPISAYAYSLNEYATSMINASKSGQTITFELGKWNSFPKSFMAKLVDKSAQNITFVFH